MSTKLDSDAGPPLVPAPYAKALEDFRTATLTDGYVLPGKVRDLGLAMAYSNRGLAARSHEHGTLAISGGLNQAEAIEGILAGVLARGFGMFWDNLWIAEHAAETDSGDAAPVESKDTSGILEYMRETFGSVPPWGEMLAATSPPTFEAYYQLRAAIMRDGALPRRYKELLLVIINCTERFDVGMDAHMKGALAAGASRAEILDAARTSIASGGIVAWLAASEVAGRVLAEAGL
jgi:alkylhydroperoxidase/carboxymuconolactone decarboxylase family protein YurZ